MNPGVTIRELRRNPARHPLGSALRRGVHLAHDGQGALDHRPHADFPDQLRAHRAQIKRIGRLRNGSLHEADFPGDGVAILLLANPAMFLHDGQDGVAAGADDVGPFPRIVAIGSAHDAGEHGRLIDPQVLRQLVQIEPRSLVDSQNRLATVVSEVDIVEVDLEDLVFRKTSVQEHGQNHLHELAPPGPLL